MAQDTNQGMQREISPAVLIGVGVVLLLALVLFGARMLAPHPPPVTIPGPEMMNEGAMKRRNIEAARQKAGQTPAGVGAAKVDRTGD